MYPSRHRLRRNKEREPGDDDKDGGGDVRLHHVVRQLPGQVKLKRGWLLARISNSESDYYVIESESDFEQDNMQWKECIQCGKLAAEKMSLEDCDQHAEYR